MPFHFCGVELLQAILAVGIVRHWLGTYAMWRETRRNNDAIRRIARGGGYGK